MTHTRKKIFALFIFLVCFLFGTNLSAMTEDLASNDIDLDTLEAFENTEPKRGYDDLSPEDQNILDTFDFLAGTVTAPLWYNTKSPSGRDVLYLLPYKISAIERGGLALNLFFNYTNNMNVGAKNLLNTEAINQELLPTFFQMLTHSDTTLSDADISSLLVLLKKITLQERRLGGIIQAGIVKGPFKIELNTSLHLAERNFWLSKADRKAIATTIGESDGSDLDESEFKRFRFGLGDTRLKLGLNTLNKTKFQIDVGFESILPTSKFSYTPGFQTTNPKQSVESVQTLGDDTIRTLKGVRDYLINPTLGTGHWGIGYYMEGKASIFHNLASMWARVSYDKLFSGKETRLILFKDTGSRQAIKTNSEIVRKASPADTPAAMAIFRASATQYLEQYLFPTAFEANVSPGDVFNAVLAISTDIKKMRFSVGYDFYLQRTEKIKNLVNTKVNMNQLLISGAQASTATQNKIFAEALYIKKYKHSDMAWGLGGDVTVASQGIGKDWTAYVKMTASF